jgi:hypothetical protein
VAHAEPVRALPLGGWDAASVNVEDPTLLARRMFHGVGDLSDERAGGLGAGNVGAGRTGAQAGNATSFVPAVTAAAVLLALLTANRISVKLSGEFSSTGSSSSRS